MLSLEIILVLGALYSFFMYATLRTQWEKREERARPKIRERRVAPGSLIQEEPTATSAVESRSDAQSIGGTSNVVS